MNRIVHHLEKCGLFSDLQYGFRSSLSTADLLTVLSDRIAMAFNRSGATYSSCSTWYIQGFWHAGLLHKVKSYGISGQIFGFISSFLSYRLLLVVVDESLHKNIQLMLDFLSFLFLVLHFSFYILMTFMMILFVILLSMLMVLLSTLNMVRHLICGNN